MKSLVPRGDAGSVDKEAITQGMETVRKTCIDYDTENIFNVDETGLLYKLLPTRGLT